MNHTKKFAPRGPAGSNLSVHATEFVFLDKKTGRQRFAVKIGKDGGMPTDQAVSLLALHCVAQQLLPRDFSVMVAVKEDLIDGLVQRVMKLIRTCSAGKPPVPLSRRQGEVLSGIVHDLSNKEIATKLNLSERTVKFHVSALLEKFDVRGRVGLVLEAADHFHPQAVHVREEKTGGIPSQKAPVAATTGTNARQLTTISLARSASH